MLLRRFSALAAFTVGLALAPRAQAHFVLKSPASWNAQDALGNPQKQGPCGSDGTVNPTNVVTAVQAGSEITITIDETIFHPGHYRVALSVNDRSELPEEPTVTAGTTACGSVPIAATPTFPVLADGALPHTKPFSGPQTIKVTLPAGVTCTKCTLQVIQFMSNHALNNPGGCFYHHCADLSIQSSAVSVDGGTSNSSGGSTSSGGASSSGASAPTDGGDGGCATGGTTNAANGAALSALGAIFGLALLRRKRAR